MFKAKNKKIRGKKREKEEARKVFLSLVLDSSCHTQMDGHAQTVCQHPSCCLFINSRIVTLFTTTPFSTESTKHNKYE